MRTHFLRALVFLIALGLLAGAACVVRTAPSHSRHPSTHESGKHGKHKHKKAKKAKKHKKHRKHR